MIITDCRKAVRQNSAYRRPSPMAAPALRRRRRLLFGHDRGGAAHVRNRCAGWEVIHKLTAMLQIAEAPRTSTETPDLRATYIQAHRWMLLARLLEEKIASLYRGGKITGGV